MEGDRRTSIWKILVYLTPVYILAAIPLYKRYQQLNSGEVAGGSAFSGEEEAAPRKPRLPDYDPGLTDSGLAVGYRAGGEADGSLPEDRSLPGGRGTAPEASRPERAEAVQGRQPAKTGGNSRFAANPAQAALVSADTKAKEQMAAGYKCGMLTETVGELLKHPKAVGLLLNNKYVTQGFMARPNVKAATGSPEGLNAWLKGPGPSNFINNSVVQAALKNPAVVSAIASSGLVSEMMKTPAAQAMLKDPAKAEAILAQNPQLANLLEQNPYALNALMANPDSAALVQKLNLGKR